MIRILPTDMNSDGGILRESGTPRPIAIRSRKFVMIRSRLPVIALILIAGALRAQNFDSSLQSAVDADPWPRRSATSSGELTIYQPQLDAWTGNMITFHAAISFQSNPNAPEMFGVLTGSARTDVDKDTRMVTLEDISITGAKFPAHPD